MALHHAVLSGFEDCVQELINCGSDVNAMTEHGVPLNLAAQKEREHVISILVGARADKVRAVDFAVARGQGVENLRSLLGLPVTGTTAESLPVLSVEGVDSLRERALAAAELGAKVASDSDHLHHATNRGSITENDKSRLPALQHDYSARRNESHSSDQAIFAGNKVEDAGRESASEDLSENTYASHLSQSGKQSQKAASNPHKNLWRKRGVTDLEDLSVLTPRQWRPSDHDHKDDETSRAHQRAHAIFDQEVTGDLIPCEQPQQLPSPVLVEHYEGQRLGLEFCQSCDPDLDDEEDFDLDVRFRRMHDRLVHDWVMQQSPVMLDFLPQTDLSSDEEPKVHFPAIVRVPVSARSNVESGSRKTDIATKQRPGPLGWTLPGRDYESA